MKPTSVWIFDGITALIFATLLGLSVYTIIKKKSTRQLFSISLWITWLNVAGLMLLPEIYKPVMEKTLICMLILLFCNSAEYREGKQPQTAPQTAAK